MLKIFMQSAARLSDMQAADRLKNYRQAVNIEVLETLAQRDGFFTVEDRQHLAIPPHRFSAIAEAAARPRARARKVVAREQRRAALTEVVVTVRVECWRAARHRALEVGEE